MQLNYRSLGSGQPLVILHGLFGMLDNWMTFGKAMESDYHVFLIDQRNHGNSPHTKEHTYKLMADDLFEFCREHDLDNIVLIGHSMGGKTAMMFALEHPEMVKALVVVDMGVKKYAGGHESIFRALSSMDLTDIRSRKQAEDQLSESISDLGVRQFLLKNLSRGQDGQYHWKFNLDALLQNYDDTLKAIPNGKSFMGKTLFVRGANSGYIKDEDWAGIQAVFPGAQSQIIEGAGHWVHADQPNIFFALIATWLKKNGI